MAEIEDTFGLTLNVPYFGDPGIEQERLLKETLRVMKLHFGQDVTASCSLPMHKIVDGVLVTSSAYTLHRLVDRDLQYYDAFSKEWKSWDSHPSSS